MAALRVTEDAVDSDVGAALVHAQWRELLRRYGVPEDHPASTDDLEADHLAPPAGVFLVGWVDDVPVACGGVRRHEDAVGEIKRMYVAPAHRGCGYSRVILRALEDRARRLGYTRLLLQTGPPQPEAVSLYESAGYARIPGYGFYRDVPQAWCYGKDLT